MQHKQMKQYGLGRALSHAAPRHDRSVMFIWCGSTSTFRPLAHIASFVYVAFFAQRTILLSFAARRLVSPALYIATREKVHTSHFSY